MVFGGGDTGANCVGTAIRQGARSVVQLELLPRPPVKENKWLTWPHWPMKLRTSTSHEEGGEGNWAIGTKTFLGDNGWVTGVQTVRLEWRQGEDSRWTMQEIPGRETVLPAELVLLALGFSHPIHKGMLQQLGVALDAQGNVRANTDNHQTSINKVFTAGDMRRGQSLVVWVIREGRQCARAVDEFLRGDRIWRGRAWERRHPRRPVQPTAQYADAIAPYAGYIRRLVGPKNHKSGEFVGKISHFALIFRRVLVNSIIPADASI